MERSLRNKLLVTVLAALLAVFALTLFPKANEAYADSNANTIASGTCGTCDWAIELDSSNNGVLTIRPTSGDSGQLASCLTAIQWPWYKYRSNINKVEIEAGVTEGNSMAEMFADCQNLTDVSFPSGFGSNALLMNSMFYFCIELNPTTAFPAGFGSNAITMESMFQSCDNFNPTTAFPAGFGSQAKNMNFMFDSCSAFTLTNPFPADFGSQVTNMDCMFAGCICLVSIDLSSMNTTQVVSGDYVFDTCTNLRMVKLGENWTFNGADESRNSGMNFPDASVTDLTTGKWICIDGQNEGKVYAASEIPDGAGTYKWETTYTIENKEALEEVLKAYKEQNPNATISVEFVASENDANADDIALIQEQAGDKELFCFDASIVVTIDGQRVTAVPFDIPLVISFSFDCSNIDELTVYRVHDGVVEELTMDTTELSEHVTVNKETNTITITASKFSTYAFAYKETVPATGDSSSAAIALSLAAMLCASACLVAVHRRKA